MSDKLTRIRLSARSPFRGLMDWGETDAAEMIRQARAYAAYLREQCEAIEAASDEHFQIDVVLGSVVQRHVKTVQSATTPTLTASGERVLPLGESEC